MRYFYFLNFICIYKNKLGESDELANVLKLANNNGKTGTQFFKTKTHSLSGSRQGLKFQGHHLTCCGKGNYSRHLDTIQIVINIFSPAEYE